jgi:hypothetical protein
LNNELQNIISAKGTTGSESILPAAARYLTASQTAGRKTEPDEFTKEQEATQLVKFITEYRSWYPHTSSIKNKISDAAEKFLLADWATGLKNK